MPGGSPIRDGSGRIYVAVLASRKNKVFGLAVRKPRGPHVQRGPSGLGQWHRPSASRFRLGLPDHNDVLYQINVRPVQLSDFGISQASIETERTNRLDRTPMPLLRACLCGYAQ